MLDSPEPISCGDKQVTLALEIRRCKECPSAKTPIPGSGNPGGSLFILKGSPDEDEESLGFAFAGRTGKAMLSALSALGVSPLAVYGTNAIKCGSGRLGSCLGNLKRELTFSRFSTILAMGPIAMEALDKTVGPLRCSDPSEPIALSLDRKTILLATLDPSDALRAEGSKRKLWSELKALSTHLRRPTA